ncbi:hypothetical protein AGABI2DRAFT_178790 [Agaricus bisporus var. bisporus H97]|uniref:hypothetical protein n=1 Tax=Agaricus bisporus var. bisporus (strain H97 / ATCC MYA-4626 / FGSC 10389) TaxID=936046 RepID=UPI00029F7C04|nr:hypothetical protein AGABI2DRAFT_178790 [Agaricus bisporus var. bisporus H97]EKV46437.1 hypothetical protein AGABI2DRAFT_178790 [Agaricus bisporus var. bisporus H97]
MSLGQRNCRELKRLETVRNDKKETINCRLAAAKFSYPLDLPLDKTLTDLQARLHEVTSVPPSNQKLLWKGKKAVGDETALIPLIQAGFKDGVRVQMLGSTEQQHINRVQTRTPSSRPRIQPRITPASSSSFRFRFHKIAPLHHLPNPTSAQTLLDKLANDPAILHVMQRHNFSVGLLTELAPHERPGLLGFNVNSGQEIKFRIRTDRYGGFRLYNDVRNVLCHERAHNVWGDHDENAPEQEIEAEAWSYVLGRNSTTSIGGDSRDDMRKRMLEAIIK